METTAPPDSMGEADETRVALRKSSHSPVVARAICAVIIALVLVLDVASIPAAYALIQTPCAPCDPNSIQATTLQVQGLKQAGVSLHFYALFTVSVIVVTEMTYIGLGVLLFVRRSDDRMTLFTALVLVTFGGAAFTGTMHAFSSAGGWLWLVTNCLNIIGQSAFIIFLYVFPTGRFVPRWMIGPAVLWCAAWVIPLFHNSTLTTLASVMTDGPVFIAIILSMIIAQVYRYQRVSSPAERQQTKWVVYGLGVGLSAFLSILVFSNVILPQDVRNNAVAAMVGSSTTYLCFLLIPIGIVAAVTRSRLFDIDILIKRTLVYGSLTAILAALYFALVIGAQTLTHQLTGQQVAQQPVVIVLSTLLIAALVQPLRRRLQGWIDRRFYRSRYDAAKTVAAFSASLRSEVNLQQLNEHLLSVVLETMRPTHVSLWLRSPAQRGQNGDVESTK